MRNRKVRRFTGAFGMIACILLITFPFYHPWISAFIERSRNTDKMSQRRLSALDRFDLYLEYALNKRLRGFGMGLYRLIGSYFTRLFKVNVLILTARGRKSGEARSVLLQFFPDGANIVIVAANSGRSSHPDWFYNLKATPTAQIQIMGRTNSVHAEELSADEAAAFWPRVLRVAPTYVRYQKATDRSIPLMRLVPVGQSGEQTLPSGETLLAREERSSIV
ncbi:MAG TPA: nitroreductase family deazaflavin-dependent oxidoreductase [Ktedonobacteraceae bacterium]|nr:nitroreductase family deazaflavin-dependent oxidoreductase [Ktedonobacteraceae bacterium]